MKQILLIERHKRQTALIYDLLNFQCLLKTLYVKLSCLSAQISYCELAGTICSCLHSGRKTKRTLSVTSSSSLTWTLSNHFPLKTKECVAELPVLSLGLNEVRTEGWSIFPLSAGLECGSVAFIFNQLNVCLLVL